jgi:hypothetical protein
MSKHVAVYIIQKDTSLILTVHLLAVIKTILAYSLISYEIFNPLNAELNPTCHFLALFGAHLILHVGKIRVKTILQ